MFQSKRKTQIENNSIFLIEKRLKKTEANIQHLNEEIEGVKDMLFLLMGNKNSNKPSGDDFTSLFPQI